MRRLFMAAVLLTASVAQTGAFEFQAFGDVPSKVTRIHLIDGSTTVLVETSSTWEVAGDAITFAAYAYDCKYGAYSQFHDGYKPADQWPVPIPEADWLVADGGWRELVGKQVCADNGLKWLDE